MNISGLASGYDAVLGRAFSGQLRSVGNVFTPRRIVHFMIDAVAIEYTDGIADPACGTGGFLVWAWRRVIQALNADVALTERQRKKRAQAFADRIYGCDVDEEAIGLAKANLALHGVRPSDGYRGHLRRHDGLYSGAMRTVDDGRMDGLRRDGFSVVACNPPFGAQEDAVSDERVLRLFELARGRQSVAPEFLFLERSIRLLAPGGRLAIIMPEGALSATRSPAPDAREYLARWVRVAAVVTIPREVWREANSRHETNASIIFGVKKRAAYDQQSAVVLATARDVDTEASLADDDLTAIKSELRLAMGVLE